ncbi:hypothetical protein [Lysobacter gummosus]|uniref:hypothetical protein n=1 Tax=Lysobacter gummosus TaxID=262324 RepID=UPI00363F821B
MPDGFEQGRRRRGCAAPARHAAAGGDGKIANKRGRPRLPCRRARLAAPQCGFACRAGATSPREAVPDRR